MPTYEKSILKCGNCGGAENMPRREDYGHGAFALCHDEFHSLDSIEAARRRAYETSSMPPVSTASFPPLRRD